MEWIKLRTLRSTWWTLAITLAGASAMAVVIGLNTKNAAGDLTNNALAGMVPGLLLTGVLGVLIMTSEYTSGMIRATLAAAPRRLLVLAAKAAVFGGVTLVLGEAAAFTAFFAGGAALRHGITAPALTQPGVLRAVVLSGASFGLIGLLGLGLGAIVRHTAGAIGVLVGGVWILAQVIGALAHGVTGRAGGGTALDPEVVSQLLAASRAGVGALTTRERDVLTLMAEGRSNAGIGRALVLSTGAVEKHAASIFGKLGLPASENDNRRVLAVLRYLGS